MLDVDFHFIRNAFVCICLYCVNVILIAKRFIYYIYHSSHYLLHLVVLSLRAS